MSRHGSVLILGVLVVAVFAALVVVSESESQAPRAPAGHRTIGWGQIAWNFAGPERWAMRFRREHRKVVALKRELREQRRVVLADPQVAEAINLAATVYGNAPTLWRKARCETGGTFSPHAFNGSSSASGLFQFLPSTWRSTPFGVFSVWSPYANALAAGWMHASGRGGEWSCR